MPQVLLIAISPLPFRRGPWETFVEWCSPFSFCNMLVCNAQHRHQVNFLVLLPVVSYTELRLEETFCEAAVLST